MIKNLLFDLGGVIMDIKRENCVDALTRLGMDDADSMLGVYAQSGEFALLEDGKLSADEFRNAIRPRFSRPVSDTDIDEALFKFLLGIPRHRLEALRSLRAKYGIYMLSNTNPIMFENKIREYFAIEGKEMEDYFDGIVTSYKAQASKPNPEIFRYAARTLGIKPEETLFFDDSQKNIDAAVALGFNGYLVEPGTEFTDYFKS